MTLLSLQTIQHCNDVMKTRNHFWKGIVCSGVELAHQTNVSGPRSGLNRADNLCDVDVNDSGWLKRKDNAPIVLNTGFMNNWMPNGTNLRLAGCWCWRKMKPPCLKIPRWMNWPWKYHTLWKVRGCEWSCKKFRCVLPSYVAIGFTSSQKW